MKLLEELRNLDVGDPGLWSTRVSVVLACTVFLLIAVLGLRIRVFGQLAPRLEAAGANNRALEQQLAETRNEARATRTVGKEAEQAEELLKAAAVWIPALAPELDLPVALAAGPQSASLQAVRPWEAPANLSLHLQQTGAELDLSGSYTELIAFLDHALHSTQLRELIELSVESSGPENPGRLRAAVRLVAYFGGPGAAQLLRAMPENPAPSSAAEFVQPLAGRPSPFGDSPASAEGEGEPRSEARLVAFRERGFVRVGGRRYAIMQDAGGKFSLEGEDR